MKKKLALFMIILLLMDSFSSFAGITKYDGNNDSISNWTVYKSVQGLDPSLPYKITMGQFNKELWEEKHVVVYGDYTLVPNNDFKVVTGGYYELNGVKGEYRFHGYDVNGGPHADNDFPPDADNGSKLESRKYVYEPWNVGSIGNRLFNLYVGSRASDYNKVALDSNSPYAASVAKWINQGLSFDIKNITGTSLSNPSVDPVHYLSVQTAPTSVSSGQGTLIHIDKYGNDWYFTVPITPTADKMITPVEALIPSITVSSISNNGDVTLKVRVTGELKDTAYYNDPIQKSIYYTRYDIKRDGWAFKLYDNISKTTLTAPGTKSTANKGYADFEVKLTQMQYKAYLKSESDNSFDVTFTGTSTVDFYSVGSQRKYSEDTVTALKNVIGIEPSKDEVITPPVDPLLPVQPKPILFDLNAPKEILDVWNFNIRVTEIDITKAVDMYVTVNGSKLSDSEEATFLSGNYKFPDLDEDKAYEYSVVYVHENGDLYFYQSYVIVYDAVPRATVRVVDPGKINRKVSITADKSVSSDFLEANSNIQISSFTISSIDGQQIYYGSTSSQLKEYLVKQVGTVVVTVVASNEYGSRSYSHEIYAGEDYAADLVAIIWNSNLSRLDNLDMFAEGTSLDGDTVGAVTYEIFYDSNNDQIPETLVKSGTWTGTTDYKPDKLGTYKVVYKVKEEFGQATIPQHITDADKKLTTVERVFFVENLVPMTKVYTDIEYNFPSLDVVFMVDQTVPRTENDYFKTHQVDISNNFRVNSMMANVDIFDMFTYTFSQTAYDRIHSGGSYPAATTNYSNNGYNGPLARTSVSNYPYTVDNGYWATRTLSMTVTMSKSGWGVSGSGTTQNADGGHTSWTNYWATYSYNSGGYSGSTSGSGYSYTTYDKTGKVTSSGSSDNPTASGTAYKTETYWQSSYSTYDDYYGDYSGTVYKYVKQAYSPSYQTTSNKYIIYVAKDGINNLSDFNYVKNIARDAKVILIGTTALKSQIASSYFIQYTTDTQSLIDQVIQITKTENPIVNELAVLIGETFSITNTDIDAEGDPIIESGYQYTHDPNYFDNSLGQESGTYLAYGSNQFSSTVKSSFSKPGKYTIYRRIKDQPIGFTSMASYSNLGSLEIVVHRKPIANATLDWDYNSTLGNYQTTWVDKSYDPDFQYSDSNKGIVDRKIKYKLSSSSTWLYEIPNNLVPGTYNLEYVVMDKHGIWSDPFTMNFTLNPEPPMQFTAQLRATSPGMALTKFTIGNDVEWYGVWSRFPYAHRLEVSLWDGATRVSNIPIKTINYSQGVTATKSGNDYTWNNITLNLPKGIGLLEKTYQVRIEAISNSNPSNRTTINQNITLVNNTAPTLSISKTPTVVYENDNVSLILTPFDADMDSLVATSSLYKDNVLVNTLTTNIAPVAGVYAQVTLSAFTNITLGNYRMDVVLRDPANTFASQTLSFSANPLMIDGAVAHTTDWNNNRLEFNAAMPSKSRDVNTFWSGESFVLNADTTIINAASSVVATSVDVTIQGTTYNNPSLTTSNHVNWSGTLWNESMINKWGQVSPETINFIFTVRYSNGAIKTDIVPVTIDDRIKYWELHRKF